MSHAKRAKVDKDAQKNYLRGDRVSRRIPGSIWTVSKKAHDLYRLGVRTGLIIERVAVPNERGGSNLEPYFLLPGLRRRIIDIFTNDMNHFLRTRGEPNVITEIISAGVSSTPENPPHFIPHHESWLEDEAVQAFYEMLNAKKKEES